MEAGYAGPVVGCPHPPRHCFQDSGCRFALGITGTKGDSQVAEHAGDDQVFAALGGKRPCQQLFELWREVAKMGFGFVLLR
jgi:hypothetical protein